MEVITIESLAFKKIIDKIDSLIENRALSISDLWLTNDQFIKVMGISRRTAQSYRDNGIIRYSQVGAKIYYKVSDIDTLLKESIINKSK